VWQAIERSNNKLSADLGLNDAVVRNWFGTSDDLLRIIRGAVMGLPLSLSHA
jgi:hypothetical protein